METLKKGKYYIGDPCYIFDESWTKILQDTDYFNANNGKVKIGKKEGFVGSTAYGDGSYRDQDGNEYWVDAGLIGCLPISMLKIDNHITENQINESKGMHIMEFKEDFKVSCEGGVFNFGNIVIDTANQDEDEGEND